MTRNTILMSLLAFLCACNYTQYTEKSKYNISQIPVIPHKNPVEVFLQSEVPTEEYFKIASVVVSSRYDNFDKMLAEARQKAQSIGYDGIIVMSFAGQTGYDRPKHSITFDQSNMAGKTGADRKYYQSIIDGRTADGSYQQRPYSYQELTVMGIKYKKNINYLDQIIKAEHFYTDSVQQQSVATLHYDFNGTITKTQWDTTATFDSDLSRFNPDLLVKGTKGWEYRTNKYNVITHRRFMHRDFPLIVCKLTYNVGPQPKVVSVYIKESYPPKNEGHNYIMHLSYTASGAISNVTVYTAQKNKRLVEQRIYHYDENNKFLGKSIQLFHGSKKQYTTKAEYYSNDLVATFK